MRVKRRPKLSSHDDTFWLVMAEVFSSAAFLCVREKFTRGQNPYGRADTLLSTGATTLTFTVVGAT